jgi:hypothetical protein
VPLSVCGAKRRPGIGGCLASVVTLSVATACTSEAPRGDPREGDWHSPAVVAEEPFRAFDSDSWWNTPVPRNAPSHPRAEQVLEYMHTAEGAGDGCVRLSGAEDSPWGQPVYWAEPGDPEYDVAVDAEDAPEFRTLRIPQGADPAGNNDGSMTVFDVERGYVVAFTEAAFDADTETWSARAATVTYLDSNGLHARTGRSTDSRNVGTHRGNNGAVMMARFDEVEAGHIAHVLKVASGPEVSRRFVFPMVGSDGNSRDRAAPPQGLRFRIKPSIDLETLDLEPQALVIATALQQYGFYIGDSAGVTSLKLEDTETEGRGQLWEIPTTALCGLPLSAEYWDVLPEGYEPPQHG